MYGHHRPNIPKPGRPGIIYLPQALREENLRQGGAAAEGTVSDKGGTLRQDCAGQGGTAGSVQHTAGEFRGLYRHLLQ